MSTNRINQNDPEEFEPVKGRNYTQLNPQTEAQKEMLEKKLNIPAQLIELKGKAHQRWAQVPHEEMCNRITTRVYSYGDGEGPFVGIIFTVSTDGDDFDTYAAFLCPTKKDAEDFMKDMNDLSTGAGFKPEVWKN